MVYIYVRIIKHSYTHSCEHDSLGLVVLEHGFVQALQLSLEDDALCSSHLLQTFRHFNLNAR